MSFMANLPTVGLSSSVWHRFMGDNPGPPWCCMSQTHCWVSMGHTAYLVLGGYMLCGTCCWSLWIVLCDLWLIIVPWSCWRRVCIYVEYIPWNMHYIWLIYIYIYMYVYVYIYIYIYAVCSIEHALGFKFCCLYHWSWWVMWHVYPYPSGLLHRQWGNHRIAPVPVKQPWRIWGKFTIT